MAYREWQGSCCNAFGWTSSEFYGHSLHEIVAVIEAQEKE